MKWRTGGRRGELGLDEARSRASQVKWVGHVLACWRRLASACEAAARRARLAGAGEAGPGTGRASRREARLLGEDQLPERGATQPVELRLVFDENFAAAGEQVAAAQDGRLRRLGSSPGFARRRGADGAGRAALAGWPGAVSEHARNVMRVIRICKERPCPSVETRRVSPGSNPGLSRVSRHGGRPTFMARGLRAATDDSKSAGSRPGRRQVSQRPRKATHRRSAKRASATAP